MPVKAEQACQWAETRGEAPLENMTAEEARQLALSRARARAVEQVAGIEVRSHMPVLNAMPIGEFVQSLAHGYIFKEEVLQWEQKAFQEAPEKTPHTLYRVRLRACVSPEGSGRDPYFTVDAELNKTTFVAEEEARLAVRCSRDCYVTIFNLSATNHFSILLPNPFQRMAPLRADQRLVFPQPGSGLALVMRPMSEHRRDTEAFLIVATKQYFDVHARLEKWKDISIGDVSRILLDLPASERAVALLVYEVRAQ
jgi:hypothetical protein